TQAEIDASTNSIGYKNSVNTSALCGFTNWRLPTLDELYALVDPSEFDDPRINKTWFPNTVSSIFWTSTFHSDVTAYYVQFYAIGFGTSGFTLRKANGVRLVRSNP
ncbi:MAG: DUF1566 domain-containing protein, partial [Rhodoferax sp.]|nr:DUF1566 domain-containing protein [Rhodoferax sp.]